MQTAENKAAMARDQTDAFLNFMPGQRLRRARELRGMTQEQAGAELNLSLRFIEAIESDNYDVLPGSVFARGYMRSYARLLHLDDNDVVAKFDQALDARRPEPTESRANPIRLLGQIARSPRKQVSRMLWMVSAGMLVMMVAGAFIWSSHESFNPGPALEKIHTHDVTETSTASPSVIAPVSLPLPSVAGHSGVGGGAGVDNAAAPSPAAAAVPLPMTVVVNSVPVAKIQPLNVESAAVVTVDPMAKTAMQIHLKGDSWVRVTDAQGHLQAEGLHHAGENLSVDGIAPWHLRVGNAENVSVSVQGKSIDLSSHTHDHIADLTIQP